MSNYPAGVTDNDPYFTDNTEPDLDDGEEIDAEVELRGWIWPKDYKESSEPIPRELWACTV